MMVYCGNCRREFAEWMAPEGCPVCGAPVKPAALKPKPPKEKEKPADPRLVKPVGNREVKPR